MALYPLGEVKELVESVGMGISYAYEDLVFFQHNAFLLQFSGDGTSMQLHANEKAARDKISENFEKLAKAAPFHDLTTKKGRIYKLSETDDTTVTLAFY